MSKRYDALDALPSALTLADGVVIARANTLYKGTALSNLFGLNATLNIVYVSKSGNDSNAGTNPITAKLTIGAAVTAAAAQISGGQPRATVVVVDSGTYTEDVTLSAGVSLQAPFATLVGALVLDVGCHANLLAQYANGDSGIMVNCVTNSGELSVVEIKLSDGRGVAGTNTGNVNFKNDSSGRVLMVRCWEGFVAQGGEFCRDGSGAGFGHVHLLVGDVYLAGNNARGIRTNNANTKIVGWIDHILEINSPTGTIGISMVDAGAIVALGCAEIIADEVWNISAGDLYLTCPKLTGTKTGSAVFDSTSKEDTANKDVANGYCGLDASGFIDPSRLPGTVKGIRTPTGTADQFVLADAGKIVEFDNASAISATVPDNATVAFPVGTVIHCAQVGAGQVTFVAGGSTVLRSDTSKLKTNGQWTTCFLYKRGTNEWVLSGNIAA